MSGTESAGIEMRVREAQDATSKNGEVPDAAPPPPSPQAPAPTSASPPPVPAGEDQAGSKLPDLPPAKRLFSETILKDPRSHGAVKALRALAPDDRIEQLCNIEAMEQIHRLRPSRRPDFIIAYAIKPPALSGAVFTADGAAFHDRKHWVRMRYRCGVSPDHAKVTQFAFAIGEDIAADQWSSYSLPTEDGASD
ncbi:DUF930 domain-containing protein [Xaviernesmea oryzae]|uniref:DUF930 domain-containing protein n=1 Tax=Xaviernesmea oryzae TaxID=464029 RepID=UPI00147EEC07|nr:DUF930 domain-containing protein [Xaviernesmea oryzae]